MVKLRFRLGPCSYPEAVSTLHCALEWSGFTCKRAKEDIYDTIALGLLKKEELEEEERRTIFLFARRVRKLALSGDVIHSFDWKSAVEHDGGV